MVKVIMWEIRGKNPKKYYTRNYKTIAHAKHEVKEWNKYDNPYDRIGIKSYEGQKPKRRANPFAMRSLSGRLI